MGAVKRSPSSRRMRLALLALPVLAAACATPAAPRDPLRYPALPPSTAVSGPAFAPDASLVAASLACRGDEPARPNGLDDDCDGRIDGVDEQAPVSVVLAYPRALPLTVGIAEPATELPQPAPRCDDESAYCTLWLTSEQLPRGTHALVLRVAAEPARSAPAPVVVSVRAAGKVSTYWAPLGADDHERTLGSLSLP